MKCIHSIRFNACFSLACIILVHSFHSWWSQLILLAWFQPRPTRHSHNIFIIVHDSDKQATSSHYHSNSVHADGSKMWGMLVGNTVVTLRERLSLSSPLATSSTGAYRPRLNALLCVALPWGIMELLSESDSRTAFIHFSYCRRATRGQCCRHFHNFISS